MKNIFLLACSLLMGINQISCQNKNGEGEKYLLNPTEFEQKIATLPNEQLLDIRTAQEIASGKLKDAMTLDFNAADFQQQATQQLDKTKPVMLYCYSGGRSSDAATLLRKEGYTVYELDGGIAKWKKENKEIVSETNSNTAQTENNPKNDNALMTLASFQQKIAGDKPVLVDFTAVWCMPCKKMKPTIDKLAEEMKATHDVIMVDVDKQEDIATAYKVEAMPTLMLFKKSAVVWQKVGLTEEPELRAALTANK
jgi:thioredoxin 1